MIKYYVYHITEGEHGQNLHVSAHNKDAATKVMTQIIRDVHPNVVRCALGEDTVVYLSETVQDYYCQVSENEITDFKKHRVI